MTRFRVATYNVHKCRGLDGRVRVERIGGILRQIESDLTAVQEITRSQAEWISKDLGLPHWFGTATQFRGEDYGNATFTRLAVTNAESFDLTVPNREARQCLRVDTASVTFFNVHLGTSFGERRKQARMLLSDHIVGRPELVGRRIVAGDFNEWIRGLTTLLLRHHLRSADHVRFLQRRATYPGVLPLLHLDHVYYDQAFQLVAMALYQTPTTLVASDHLPLIADFVSI